MEFLHLEGTFNRSKVNDKKHVALLQASISEENPKSRNIFPMNIVKMEHLFDLRETYIKTRNKPS
jgi:hypothetical protein